MPSKLQLDLPILLPDVPDLRDACVESLVSRIRASPGVEEVHVLEPAEGRSARLCIHHDPDTLPLPRIRKIAESAGASLTDHYGHLLIEVEGIRHQRHAQGLTAEILNLPGVIEAEATLSGPVRIEFDREMASEDAILAGLSRLGIEPRSSEAAAARSSPGNGPHGHGLAGKQELAFSVIGATLLAAGGLAGALDLGPPWAPQICFVAAYLFGGYYTFREVASSLGSGQFQIDFLMVLAAGGAAILGAWAEGALLLVLFSLGHALEHFAMHRAQDAISALASIVPDRARIVMEGKQVDVPVVELQVGQQVAVAPGERIPADGFIRTGSSELDQSSVTGESIPAEKCAVANPESARGSRESIESCHRVFAGTINGSGALVVEVLEEAENSTVARMIQLVSEGETQKSPTQKFAESFERIFVPAVLALVVILLFAWVVIDESLAESFYRAMAVLVAASPCALAISTPSAVLCAVARAGQRGVLIKGGRPLEELGQVSAIAFDKTGTLTEGRPRLTDVLPVGGATRMELIVAALALERLSGHPLARAIVRDGSLEVSGEEEEVAQDLQSREGLGLEGRIGSDPVAIGCSRMFQGADGSGLPEEIRTHLKSLEESARTCMVVRRGDRFLGVLGLIDGPREAARQVVSDLRRKGITRVVMLSGDSPSVAEVVAKQIGIEEVRGGLLPVEKARYVDDMRRSGDRVAMIGDGYNDAPAMARATVGIAMGAAGSPAALETADVALMADDLRQLPFAIDLSRQARRVIAQNLWISLGMVAILVPTTIFGLGIGPAVVLHEGSTLLVVLNALRLLRQGSQD